MHYQPNFDVPFLHMSSHAVHLLQPRSVSHSSAPPIVMCARCKLQLYAPAGGGLFRCPTCDLTQRLPPPMEENLRTSYGITCNVPGCTCQRYHPGRPSGTPVKPHGIHACANCHHKRSMHQILVQDSSNISSLPSYWEGDLSKSSRKQVHRSVLSLVQELMAATWKNVASKDRLNGTQATKFEVVQVLRNQNPRNWWNYVAKREVVREEMSKNPELLQPKTAGFFADALKQKLPFASEHLHKDVNEMFLFHGTKPSAASSICDTDFKTTFTGTNRGTLLGQGIYFAESSSKSDEYAQDDPEGLYQGLFATLLCRVTMGNYNLDEMHVPDAAALSRSVQQGNFHSVLGDREKIRGTFREFVVFNGDQVYPEFIIIYRRVYE